MAPSYVPLPERATPERRATTDEIAAALYVRALVSVDIPVRVARGQYIGAIRFADGSACVMTYDWVEGTMTALSSDYRLGADFAAVLRAMVHQGTAIAVWERPT